MNKPLALCVVGLIALGCLSPEVTAQKRSKKRAAQAAGVDTFIKYRQKNGEQVVFEDPGETYQPGTNVPMAKRVAIKGLGKFVVPFVGINPGRLAPGQSGELRMVLALKGNYVFEEGMHFALRYRHQQGQISFGNWRLEPARVGKLNTVFRGLPVYDNTASIVIPISIGGSAVYGEKTVGFEVEVDVTDGKSGNFYGRHTMDVKGKVLVGLPLPVIQTDSDQDADALATQVGVVESSVNKVRTGSGERLVPADGTLRQSSTLSSAASSGLKPGSNPLAGPDGEATDIPDGEDSSASLLLYSVPVVLLLLILAMAFGRGKGKG